MGRLGEDKGNRLAKGVFSIRDHPFDRDLQLLKLVFDLGEQGGQIALSLTSQRACQQDFMPDIWLQPTGGEDHVPIRINLRSPCPTRDQQVGLLKGWVQEQLKRIGMFAAFVDATAIKSLRDFLQDVDQIIASSQCTSHQIDLVTDGFGGFDHTSAWNLPTAYNHHPMHDNHANQFGVKVAEQVPRILAAGNVRLSVLFPQLE